MDCEKLILDALKKSPMTVNDISSRIRINRLTASKYLAVLEAKGLLCHREKGRAKLFSLAKGGKNEA